MAMTDTELHDANRLAHAVARAARKRHEIESEWAATYGSSQRLHLAYRLLSANNALSIALEEYGEATEREEG